MQNTQRKIQVIFSKDFVNENIIKLWENCLNVFFKPFEFIDYYIISFYCLSQSDITIVENLMKVYHGKIFGE